MTMRYFSMSILHFTLGPLPGARCNRREGLWLAFCSNCSSGVVNEFPKLDDRGSNPLACASSSLVVVLQAQVNCDYMRRGLQGGSTLLDRLAEERRGLLFMVLGLLPKAGLAITPDQTVSVRG